MREVRIVKVLNGYIVTVGCQTLVFDQQAFMLAELARYFTNPAEVEKEYLSKFGGHELNVPTPPYAEQAQCASESPDIRFRGGVAAAVGRY